MRCLRSTNQIWSHQNLQKKPLLPRYTKPRSSSSPSRVPGCEVRQSPPVPNLNLSPLEFWGEDLLNFASGRELQYDISRRKFTFFYAVLVCNTYKGTHTHTKTPLVIEHSSSTGVIGILIIQHCWWIESCLCSRFSEHIHRISWNWSWKSRSGAGFCIFHHVNSMYIYIHNMNEYIYMLIYTSWLNTCIYIYIYITHVSQPAPFQKPLTWSLIPFWGNHKMQIYG